MPPVKDDVASLDTIEALGAAREHEPLILWASDASPSRSGADGYLSDKAVSRSPCWKLRTHSADKDDEDSLEKLINLPARLAECDKQMGAEMSADEQEEGTLRKQLEQLDEDAAKESTADTDQAARSAAITADMSATEVGQAAAQAAAAAAQQAEKAADIAAAAAGSAAHLAATMAGVSVNEARQAAATAAGRTAAAQGEEANLPTGGMSAPTGSAAQAAGIAAGMSPTEATEDGQAGDQPSFSMSAQRNLQEQVLDDGSRPDAAPAQWDDSIPGERLGEAEPEQDIPDEEKLPPVKLPLPSAELAPSGSRPGDTGVVEFTITVDKTHGGKLGMRYDDSDGICLVVKDLKPGLLYSSLQENPSDKWVMLEDRIVEVNGVKGNSELLEEQCMQGQVLHLTIRRLPLPAGIPRETFTKTDNPSVVVHAYDLFGNTPGTLACVSKTLNCFSTRFGMFHTGVEVFGQEWYFGGRSDGGFYGLAATTPREHPHHRYAMSVLLGETALDREAFEELIPIIRMKWPSWSYHALQRNCHSFTDFLCKILGFEAAPKFGIFSIGDPRLVPGRRENPFHAREVLLRTCSIGSDSSPNKESEAPISELIPSTPSRQRIEEDIAGTGSLDAEESRPKELADCPLELQLAVNVDTSLRSFYTWASSVYLSLRT